jgi:D-sedoheptulose 7-phosphate isomerase
MSDRSEPLEALYPFLRGRADEPSATDAVLAESVRGKATHSADVKRAFFEARADALVAAARAVADVYRCGGRVFAMGNGGSSCDAAHFAVEFMHPVTAGRPALPAVDLAADTAMMSAVGNDVGFERVFARQLVAQARRGDGLVGFSTSGDSANLLAAYAAAKPMGLTTLGFAGGDGGKMARSADVDYCLVVPTDSIHRVQETHVAAYHILWDLVHTLLAGERGRSGEETRG